MTYQDEIILLSFLNFFEGKIQQNLSLLLIPRDTLSIPSNSKPLSKKKDLCGGGFLKFSSLPHIPKPSSSTPISL